MSSTSASTQPTNEPVRRFRDPEELLRYLYADLTRISEVVSPDIALHPADAEHPALHGIAAVQAHEEALVAATDGTLRMEISLVSVVEDTAVVSGFMRARKPGLADLEAEFMGSWKFVEGVPVEHWERLRGDAKDVARRWFADANRARLSC
ncbi:hypothetical protein F4823DRAFT_549910 [Ustulina deusta]|nr:hypothetical protein F4823DRAFT_549910 [Ustulina deusta]